MNTPPTPKRWNPEVWRDTYFRKVEGHVGTWESALVEPKAALLFATFVTNFTELEHRMEAFAARLLGTDSDIASIAMRNIVSIQSRIDLLEAVLSRGRRNYRLPVLFDEIINEFKSLKRIRNDYVHGRWKTHPDGQVWVVKLGADPLIMDDVAAEKFVPDELIAANERTNALIWRLSDAISYKEPRPEPDKPDPEPTQDQDGQTPREEQQPPPPP